MPASVPASFPLRRTGPAERGPAFFALTCCRALRTSSAAASFVGDRQALKGRPTRSVRYARSLTCGLPASDVAMTACSASRLCVPANSGVKICVGTISKVRIAAAAKLDFQNIVIAKSSQRPPFSCIIGKWGKGSWILSAISRSFFSFFDPPFLQLELPYCLKNIGFRKDLRQYQWLPGRACRRKDYVERHAFATE